MKTLDRPEPTEDYAEAVLASLDWERERLAEAQARIDKATETIREVRRVISNSVHWGENEGTSYLIGDVRLFSGLVDGEAVNEALALLAEREKELTK